MTYNLDTWQYACIEDDFFSIYFGFGKREFFESKDLCFSNEDYIAAEDEPPFYVNNHCYGPWNDENRADGYWDHGENMFHEPAFPGTWDYWNCHDKGYRVDLHVVDNYDANVYFGLAGKIREDYMWV
jgi:hypothetical protein